MNTDKIKNKEILKIQELFKKKDNQEIKKFLTELLGKYPNNSDLNQTMGLVLLKEKNFLAAKEFYEKSLSIDKNSSSSYYNLGIINFKINNSVDAEKNFKKSLKINSNYTLAEIGLIKLEEKNKRYDNAINLCTDALKKYNNIEILLIMGRLLEKVKNTDEAILTYKKILEMENNNTLAMSCLANILVDRSKNEEAEQLLLRAEEIEPTNCDIKYNLALLYSKISEIEKCKELIIKTKEINSSYSKIYNILTKIKKFKKYDDDISKMIELSKIEMPINDKILLLFNIGKSLDDIKDYKNAALYFNEGNKIQKKISNFKIENFKKEVLEIKGEYTREFYENNKKLGHNDDRMIFILGLPRCGSTLLEQILSSHSKIKGLGEIDNFLNSMRKNISLKENAPNEYYNNLGRVYSDSIDEAFNIEDKATDKTLNIFRLGEIKLSLPKSKIIYCSRNAKDQCLSIYHHKFYKNSQPYSYNYKDISICYKLHKDIVNHYKKIIGDGFIEVKYEKLIENPKKEINRVLNYCNLEWENNCLKFYNNKRIINTHSSIQVKENFNSNSIEKWKKYENEYTEMFDNL